MGKIWGKNYICSMSTIKYFIKGKKSPSQIYVRIRDSKDVDISSKIGLEIDPDKWSSLRGQVKQNATFPEKLNFKNKLDQLKQLISDQMQTAKLNGFELDKEWLINCIDKFHGRVKEDSTELKNIIKKHRLNLENGIKKISKSTLNSYDTTIYHIQLFEIYKKKVFHLSDVNNILLKDLIAFLKNVEKYDSSSVSNDISKIKSVCRLKRLEGAEVDDAIFLAKYPSEKSKRHVITLSEDELKLINEFKGLNYLENARDWLIIGCRTGCRVSDLLRLSSKNIIKRPDKPPLIRYTQQKTKKEVDAPCHEDVENIFEKLNGFPRKISDKNFNKFIKELCKIVGMSDMVEAKKAVTDKDGKKRSIVGIYPKHEVICSHVCRRSFCTNHYRKLSNKSIMRVTGHSTEAMFLKYIGEIDSDEIINEFDNLYKSTNQ